MPGIKDKVVVITDASFGSTGHIDCLRHDHVFERIPNQTFFAELNPTETSRIKRATLQLTNMDEIFAA
jgi:hypothetical protein